MKNELSYLLLKCLDSEMNQLLGVCQYYDVMAVGDPDSSEMQASYKRLVSIYGQKYVALLTESEFLEFTKAHDVCQC